MKKIYYCFAETGVTPVDEVQEMEKTLLSDDRFSFPIETVYANSSKDVPYYECPAWSHKAKRTFIVRSPIDMQFAFTIDRSGQPNISSKTLNQNLFDILTAPTFDDPSWYLKNPDRFTIQISLPKLYLWTKEKNIWIEQRSHTHNLVNNNFDLIGGWFNLSSWIRPISFAFHVADVNKPVNIKRGDPIYEFCLYSKNLNDTYQFISSIPNQEIKNIINRNVSLKRLNRRLSSKFMFGQEEKESKCPFSFLWKN